MNKKSKVISGLRNKKRMGNPNKYFTDSEKHHIIQEYLRLKCSKREIWQKYTGSPNEHGHLLMWMRKLGYNTKPIQRRNKTSDMKKQKAEENFENLQLKKRVEELEKKLKEAEMKAIAFSTMVDIAEEEFNIPIRKKYNTKPSKK